MSNKTQENLENQSKTLEREERKRPPLYKVILHNDDYTTMEFVVFILKVVFGKKEEEAYIIMRSVHEEGSGVCGIYTYEIAESKAQKVTELARKEEFPLKCTIDKE